MAFAERKGELWRKNQPLVTQNSVSPSRLAVYPNGRPRTRLPSRRHARPAVKRYVVEADMFEKVCRTDSLPFIFLGVAVGLVDTCSK